MNNSGSDKSAKKQLPLRISARLYDELAAWAEEDFRSVNGQIEFLLHECVIAKKKKSAKTSDKID